MGGPKPASWLEATAFAKIHAETGQYLDLIIKSDGRPSSQGAMDSIKTLHLTTGGI